MDVPILVLFPLGINESRCGGFECIGLFINPAFVDNVSLGRDRLEVKRSFCLDVHFDMMVDRFGIRRPIITSRFVEALASPAGHHIYGAIRIGVFMRIGIHDLFIVNRKRPFVGMIMPVEYDIDAVGF